MTATTATAPWAGRPKVIVLGAGDRPSIRAAAEALRPTVAACADIVLWDLAFATPLADIDADLVIVDLNLERTVDPAVLQSAADYSPRQGWHLRGWPTTTILRGGEPELEAVYLARYDALLGAPL